MLLIKNRVVLAIFSSIFLSLFLVTPAMAHPGDPSALLSKYALFGNDYIDFTEEAETQKKGWVGSNGELRQGGSWVLFNSIMKVKGSFNCGTNGSTKFADTVYTKGTITGNTALPGKLLVRNAQFPDPIMPTFSADKILSNPANRINATGTITLPPGKYGTLFMSSATVVVNVSAGEYHFDTLQIRGTLRVIGDGSGVVRLFAKKHIEFDNAGGTGHALIADSAMLGRTLLYSAGTVTIDQGSRIDAAVMAPFSHVTVKTEVVLNGQIHAKSLSFTNGFSGNDGDFIPFVPSPVAIIDSIFTEDTTGISDGIDRSHLVSVGFKRSSSGIDTIGSVDYRIESISQQSPSATVGTDYRTDTLGASLTGTMTFAKGDSVAQSIPKLWIVDDLLFEPNEKITIKLFNPVNVELPQDSVGYFHLTLNSEDTATPTVLKRSWAVGSNAVGISDSIIATFQRGNTATGNTTDSILHAVYQWPSTGLTDTVPFSKIRKIDSMQCAFAIDTTRFRTGVGVGQLRVIFRNGSSSQCAIDDETGPAAVSATCNLRDTLRQFDTIMIASTEQLALPVTSGKLLVLYADSTTTSGDTTHVLSAFQRGGSWAFVVKTPTVKDGMWVRFNSVSGQSVTELGGFRPTPINQRVPIRVAINEISTSFRSGYVTDSRGTGWADSGRVALLRGNTVQSQSTKSIESITYRWPLSSDEATLAVSALTITSETDFSFEIDQNKFRSGSGVGQIKITFKDQSTLAGSLNDSCGPAALKATCRQSDTLRIYDTLTIDITENISNVIGSRPIILYADSLSLQGDTLAATALPTSLGRHFLLPRGAVKKGQWVNFSSWDGLSVKDEKENRPHRLNRKVPIFVRSAQEPVSIDATIFDRYGSAGRVDGDGDSIAIAMVLSEDSLKFTTDSISAIEITTATGVRAVSWKRLSINTLSIVDTTLRGLRTGADIRLKFGAIAVDIQAHDSVAPVIESAVYRNWNNRFDTLVVTFTEPLKNAGTATPFLFHSGTSLSLSTVRTEGKSVVYAVTFGQIGSKDSIWIAPNMNIRDQSNNEQNNIANRHVPVHYTVVVPAVRAWYRDQSNPADGYIDRIVVEFDRTIAGELATPLSRALYLPSPRHLSLNGTAFVEGNRMYVPVSQDRSQISEPKTSVDREDVLSLLQTVELDSILLAIDRVTIEDSIAPVITAAQYSISADEQNPIDSLTITYSEEVLRLTTADPFDLKHQTGKSYRMALSSTDLSGKSSAYPRPYTMGMEMPLEGDSIWIHSQGRVTDRQGVVQLVNTVPVALRVAPWKVPYEVILFPNPCTPSDLSYINPLLQDAGAGSLAAKTVALMLRPKNGRPLPSDIVCSLKIYDPVGNLVNTFTFDRSWKTARGEWLGAFTPTNTKDRVFGGGSLLCVAFVTMQGESMVQQMMLGVKSNSTEAMR